MLIHDPDAFSIVIPTFQGAAFLRRALDYLKQEGHEGRIVISDSSTGTHKDFAKSCPGIYPELLIDVFDYDESVSFTSKLIDTLQRISSRNVLLHANDDFMVPAAVEHCVCFLEENNDFSSARGRIPTIYLERRPSPEDQNGVQVSIATNPMRAYVEEDPVRRVIAHLDHYSSTFYSVHRRKDIITALSYTHANAENVIFFQYLSSCILTFLGRIWCSDELFYVRQNHAQSWSATLMKSSYEHWPLLITSKDFSRYYGEFKKALLHFMKSASNNLQDTERRIDEAAISLFRRSFCGFEVDHLEEKKFIDRINDPKSRENALLHRIVGFALRYPDTY